MPDDPTRVDVAELFRRYLDQSPAPAVATHVATRQVVYFNRAAAKASAESGIRLEVGTSTSTLGFWRDEEEREHYMRLARRPGGAQERRDYEEEGQRGSDLYESLSMEVDGEEYVVVSVRDISDVLAVELERSEALERLERAQALAGLGDFVERPGDASIELSAGALRVLGLPADRNRISRDELYAAFHADDRARIRAASAEGEERGAFEIEHRLARGGEDEIWVSTRCTRERDAHDRPHWRGTVLDVTARRRSEQERAELQTRVQDAQRMESLGLLAGGIAHDFNNLLTGILGNTDLALQSAALDEDTRQLLTEALTAARRAAELTHQMLAYSGRGQFVVEPTDLSTLVREMAELLTASMSKDHALRLDLSEAPIVVDADATQLRQVVMNLILNASEAIEHKEGSIRVVTGTRAWPSRGRVDPARGARAALIEVTDNGTGMDEETRERVFEPFYTTKFTGRGLGLSAVKGIVAGHGGDIETRSKPGEGTTFSVLLPLSEAEATAGSDARAGDRGEGAVVLVIDDEAAIRRLARRTLERAGHVVRLADGGEAALAEIAGAEPPVDVVVLDLTMPGMDGAETLRAIRAMGSPVPVVLMSGYEQPDATGDIPEENLAGFLSKPFLIDDLLDVVEQALRTER